MTDVAVQRLKALAGERVEYFDQAIGGGLCLRVGQASSRAKDGRRSWCYYYRHNGKLVRLTLGSYPEMTLAEARMEASRAHALKKQGINPAATKAKAKAEARAAAREPDTINSLMDLFVKRALEGKKRAPKYVAGIRRNFDNHVLTRWEGRNVHAIKRRDVIELLDDIKDHGSNVRRRGQRKHIPGGPIAANRTLAALRALFNFAIRRDILESSPATLIERPGEETQRDRVLSGEELRVIWQAAEIMPYPFGPDFKMTIITGQRRSEVACMRWCDIDWQEMTWTLSAEQTKNGRVHVVPLAPLAVELLNSLPRASARGSDSKLESSPYVFTADGLRPVCGFGRAKMRLDNNITRIKGGEALTRWTIHDLRRSAATHMGRLGTSEFIVGKVLNHAPSGITGRHYALYQYLPEKRHALEIWASYLQDLINPLVSN
jgi:integrase